MGCAFERASHAKLVYVSDTTGGCRALVGGEHADLIVATGRPRRAAQEKLIAADTRVDLSRALIASR